MSQPIRTVFERYSLFRYSLVGGFCAVLNLAIQVGAVTFLNLHYLLANLLSFLVLVPLSFALQRRVAFRVAGHQWAGALMRYTIQWLAVLFLNLLLMIGFVDGMGMNGVAAILLVTALLYWLSYFGQQHWVFRHRQHATGTASSKGELRGGR